MSPTASALKKNTIERYEYLIEDNIEGYQDRLKFVNAQPDSYWEEQVIKNAGKRSNYFNYDKG